MAVFSTTELNATIDEIWDHDVDEARYQAGTIMQRVLNKSTLIAAHGDIVNLSVEPSKYSVGDVTAGTGAFVPQSMTISSVAITVNQWKQVSIEVVSKAEAQSFWKPESVFPKRAGSAMAEEYDNQLFDLDADLVTNVVNDATSPTTFDDSALLRSMLLLRDLNVPLDSLSFFLPPIAFYKGIATKPEFRDTDKTGLPKSLLLTNYRFKLLDVPAYESTLINTAGGGLSRVGLLLHKHTFAIAMQKNNEIRRAEATAAAKLSYITILNSLFGVKTFRENHGVRIHIQAS
jgi:hypothetical protein